jgi:hypothetical protein
MVRGKKQAQRSVTAVTAVTVVTPNEMQPEVRQLKAAIVNVGQIETIYEYDVIHIYFC